MGKITSMHFAGWKLGLKTGMYYLRTQAAAAPIQFTVDQEALKVEDAAAVGKERQLKKRSAPAGTSYMSLPSAVPRTGARKDSTGAGNSLSSNGIPTPSTTPPPSLAAEVKPRVVASPHKSAAMKADVAEGDSPKALPTEPAGQVQEEDLSQKSKQAEDQEDSEDRERDIYSEAVVACSIENPESCIMCSG
jgi:ribonucleoside-diphosphate reductase subunit M1